MFHLPRISALATLVETSWAEEYSRMGVLLFATSTNLVIPLQKGTRAGLAADIRAMQYYGGTTFTKLALKVALDNVSYMLKPA